MRLWLLCGVIKMFERQPIWFMKDIEMHFPTRRSWLVRNLVPVVAYLVVNGPWRSRWIKFGYNPEQEPSAR
ncbi:unnamed protein product, partial [Discosporangium mesarthrocarpum]